MNEGIVRGVGRAEGRKALVPRGSAPNQDAGTTCSHSTRSYRFAFFGASRSHTSRSMSPPHRTALGTVPLLRAHVALADPCYLHRGDGERHRNWDGGGMPGGGPDVASDEFGTEFTGCAGWSASHPGGVSIGTGFWRSLLPPGTGDAPIRWSSTLSATPGGANIVAARTALTPRAQVGSLASATPSQGALVGSLAEYKSPNGRGFGHHRPGE